MIEDIDEKYLVKNNNHNNLSSVFDSLLINDKIIDMQDLKQSIQILEENRGPKN